MFSDLPYELICGDCLDKMDDIPCGSVDMILCDLPYGITRNSWDCVIPLDKLWEQYKRITKPSAAIVLNCQQPFTSQLIVSNLADFKYCWVWSKNQCTNFLNAKKQPLRNCEDIAVFYEKQCTYNPIMKTGKMQLKNTGGKSNNYNLYEAQPHLSDEYYPTTLLEIPQKRYKGGIRRKSLWSYVSTSYAHTRIPEMWCSTTAWAAGLQARRQCVPGEISSA